MRATVNISDPGLRTSLLQGSQASLVRDFTGQDVLRSLAAFDVDSQLKINSRLYLGAILLFVASGLVLLASQLILSQISRRGKSRYKLERWLIGIGLISPLFITLVLVLAPISLPRFLGPFGLIGLFFIILTFCLLAIALLSSILRLPLIPAMLASALLFSFWNDNHGIRELNNQSEVNDLHAQTESIKTNLEQWLHSRKDLNQYQRYPIYLVAAEGGGIYAAFRAATLLSALQDACPRFDHHLFAISAVSGGSIGASVFSALVQSTIDNDERFIAERACYSLNDTTDRLYLTDVAENILKDDFLSPVFASFLFPDLLQRFLPLPIPSFDRARNLEKSLEASWISSTQEYKARFPSRWRGNANPLQSSFVKSWNSSGDAPALFINTTDVGCGGMRVISPFHLSSAEISYFPLVRHFSGSSRTITGIDISLSTAAVLSARFPWLTPPGSFKATGPVEIHCGTYADNESATVYLADGGYVDNSGVSTALEIAREIGDAMISSPDKIQINLIVLTNRGFSQPQVLFSDYLAPLEALMSVREARGDLAIMQAKRAFQKSPYENSNTPTTRLYELALQGHGYPLPLGWRLSPITRLLILGQNGYSECAQADNDDCLLKQVRDQLQGF